MPFIPLSPLWPGIIFNSLFFTTIVYLLLSIFAAWRRRRLAGIRCTTCNYDLSGLPSAVCPECGSSEPIISKSVVAASSPS